MKANGPDPLGIRERSNQHYENTGLCSRYYDFINEVKSENYIWMRLTIDDRVVTDWHLTREDCYIELADKIRQWEAANPEQAIRKHQPVQEQIG